MAQPRFGTDGIRGRAPEDLTVDLARAVGRAGAAVLRPKRAVIGRDTRGSGPALSDGVIDGLISAGVDVVDLGVLPTPGIAFVAAQLDCPGFVISASHNPSSDNGIKVIGVGGTKLGVADEESIEEHLDDPAPLTIESSQRGSLLVDGSLSDRYIDHVVGAVPPGALSGMRIALDCANGAASATAGEIFQRLGAEVVVLAVDPDGENINDGVGSTHPEFLSSHVVALGATLGLAFDGDADRLVAVDETGAVVPGDALLALFATDLQEHGDLVGDTVVVTVMSNLGFHRAMRAAGIAVTTVGVGDRNVVEAMDAERVSLGGEQSGHIIFRELATTGDGVLTGVILADLVNRSGQALSALSSEALTLVPQYLQAVPIAPGSDVQGAQALWSRVAEMEASLGERGRILVRASGTEPVVRVMVEADDDDEARALTEELAALVRTTLGASTAR
jgi:phosphoglucosamine mutase